MTFAPASVGTRTCTISLGDLLPPITLQGTTREPVISWLVEPSPLLFDDIVAGESSLQGVLVTNTGEAPLEIDVSLREETSGFYLPEASGGGIGPGPSTIAVGAAATVQVGFAPAVTGLYETELLLGDGIEPALPRAGGPFRIEPGSQIRLSVTFRPLAIGSFETVIDPGEGLCSQVTCSGQAVWTPDPEQNRVGLFFDPAFTVYQTQGMLYEPFDLYLALMDCSSPEGVGGWECRLATRGGEALQMGSALEGQALNLLDPPSYLVGTGVPLPPVDSNVLLARFTFLALTTEPIFFELHPIYVPSIEDEMAWLTADLQQVWPMRSYTGQPEVAVFSPQVLAIDAPPPAARTTGAQVTLRWERPAAEFDDCRVSRRRGTAGPEPVGGAVARDGSDLTFTDDVSGYAAGQVLHYGYALYRDGREIARSPEVEVTVPAAPALTTQLLPNVPNPFNPQTEIRFRLEKPCSVRVVIFDVQGRKVRTLVADTLDAGPRSRTRFGRDDGGRPAPSGAYYVRLETGDRTDTRKILLLR